MTRLETDSGSESRQLSFGRREFLIRAGIVGAALSLGDTLAMPGVSWAAGRANALAPLFDALAKDTISGLIAFVVPGPDAYSLAQGESDTAPGGIDADGVAFLLNALDNFYPIPAEPMRLVVQALGTALSENLPELPPAAVKAAVTLAAQLDKGVEKALGQQGAMPLSALVALLLNLVATMVEPTSVHGKFVSPFANLTFAQKIKAFEYLEEDYVTLAALLDTHFSEPLKQSFSGLLAFLAGALLEFSGFGSFNEFGVFDRATRKLASVPVGWTLTGYLAETDGVPVEGWDEFKGYYAGNRSVTD